MTDDLTRLVQSFAPPFAFCGIGVSHKGKRRFHIGTAPGFRADENNLFRVASISKIVTGRAFRIVAENAGLRAPYATDISDVLGWPLRNPAHPGAPLTLGQIACHTGSLTDDAGYLIPGGTTLQDWFRARPDAFLPQRPGTFFHYSNLGYVLLAAATEAMAGDRFDHLARDLVLDPAGIDGGFNWSGVSADRRMSALPTCRQDSTGLHPQIDAVVAARGVSGPDGAEIDLEPHIPGENPGPFSPQGGLRISLAQMLSLGQSLEHDKGAPLWTPSHGAGDLASGAFESYGTGLQYFESPAFYPRPLVGHFANAYGFAGGVWWDSQARAAFAYGLNGLSIGDEDDAFSNEELAIFAAMAQALA